MATEFTESVIYWLLEMERHAALDRTGDEDDAAEWENVGSDIEFTLHDDERARRLIADLDKFHRVMHDDIHELAQIACHGDVDGVAALVAVSLASAGDGIESAYLSAADDQRERAKHYGKLMGTVLDLAFPADVSLTADPAGVAYVD